MLARALSGWSAVIAAALAMLPGLLLGAGFYDASYIWREEPHLVGPARRIAAYPPGTRRLFTLAMAVAAAGAVLLVAKPFAKALVSTGVQLGIDEFMLVQWLAPLASEAPEFVVVSLYAWRGLSTAAMTVLVSSKINQWTLLVAMLPLVYSVALGRPDARRWTGASSRRC